MTGVGLEMREHTDDKALADDKAEIQRLKALNRDLLSLLALPAMSPATAEEGPASVLQVAVDVLFSMLRLDFAYARLDRPPAEGARMGRNVDKHESAQLLAKALHPVLAHRATPFPTSIPNPNGEGEVRLSMLPLGEHGLLVAGSQRQDFPAERDVLLFRVAANQTVIGLEVARLMHERSVHLATERRRGEVLHQLSRAALEIHSAASMDAALQVITERARQIIGAKQAVTSLTVGPDQAQEIRAVSLSEEYAAYRGYGAKTDGSGIYQLVTRYNRPMRLTQAQLEAHPAWRGFGQEAGRHPPMNGWLALPLVGRDGRNLGLIQLSHKDAGDFDENDEQILTQLAQVGAIAVENARLYEQLAEANQRKDEFLAMLGHELRNPLAPILTALHLIQLKGSPSVERERAVIERQVTHMSRLVDDLLDVSRITRGKIELKREPIELSAVVAKAIEMVSPLLEERLHRLEVEVPRSGLRLSADPVRLAQVFGNVLTNAAKYTEKRGLISIKAWRSGDELVVSVKDNGTGISPSMLSSIFEMFVQGARTIDRNEGGLGLGLPIVRSLVALHGGTVTALSEGLGKGSEFVLRFPALGADEGAVEPSVPPSPAAASGSAGGRRVLLVDDNVDAAEALAEFLRMVGHDVLIAHDAPSALDLAEEAEFDLALVDIGLPVMDGYELARRLRRLKGSTIKLFAVTGYGQDHDRARSLEAGIDLHLVKPVDLDALHERIEALPRLGAATR